MKFANKKILENLTVIFYGSTKFSPKKFKTIKNCWVKPLGGLWTSPINAEYGWREWCIEEQFRKNEEENSFKLKFQDNAKILIIDKLKDLIELPRINDGGVYYRGRYLDFENILTFADAIWLTTEGQWKTRLTQPYNLYGWDCECILIMNKKCVYQVF